MAAVAWWKSTVNVGSIPFIVNQNIRYLSGARMMNFRCCHVLLKYNLSDMHAHINRKIVCKCKIFSCIRNFVSALKPAKILGIESSCDETGAAVVDEEGTILGEAVHSQHDFHLKMGGIIPPLAFRLHEQNIENVVNQALINSRLTMSNIDAVAVTVMPGLSMSLSVGVKYAKRLCQENNLPLIPIHHMQAHALTARMVEEVNFPFLVLLVSGGHCLLVVASSLDKWTILGQTMDNAPGEVLDKVSRRLRLRHLPSFDNMSGGRAIETLARTGNPRAFPFILPMSHYRDCSFSFAGLMFLAERTASEQEKLLGIEGGNILPNVNDICASFQYAVTKHLLRQTQKAFVYTSTRELLPDTGATLVMSGGVACNRYIRDAIGTLCAATEHRLVCPPVHLCSDNGAMIAWNGMEKWKEGLGVLWGKEEIEAVRYYGKSPIGEDVTEDVRSLGIHIRNWVRFQ